ncbi:MAG: peptidylprolyl isomerase [Gammaproteobacteria bacterium]|nr:peptidylprolyl isomerase [Gammaproteobacteria bacterium]
MVSNGKVVSIHYTLKDDEGTILDSSSGKDPLAYLHGANNVISGLESAMEGKKTGESFSVRIEPSEAYGEKDETKMQVLNRSMFGEHEVQIGQQFHAADPEGNSIVVTVTNIDGDEIIIDGNHPLAGITLNFDVEVVDIRDASDEEISHGHVHGEGGHHH